MLSSVLGVRLMLLTGDTIPLPVGPDVMAALTDVSVTNDAKGNDGFQMTFTLGKDLLGDYALIRGMAVDPMTRVVVVVLMGAMPEVLIDGVITHHSVAPSNEPGKSTLSVTGKDLTQLMDLEERNESYENMPDFAIATTVLARYAKYGLAPLPAPTTDVPLSIQRVPRQQETDLAFLRRLAQRNGYVFYIEALTVGMSQAYWGPEIRVGLPQSALTINMGPDTNLRSLSFAQDALAPVAAKGIFVEPITKITIPIPELPPLRVPLALRPTPARRKVLLRDTAQEGPGQAATSVISAATNAPDPVTGQGELDGARYGKVLRARKLVGVRGAGLSYDGLYYVSRVTHSIRRGDYTQSFSLAREGTISLTPVVVP